MNQINPVPDKRDMNQQSVLSSIHRPQRGARADLARRSWRVTLLKWVLPGVALVLLIALAIAPSWHTGPGANRVTYHLSNSQSGATSSMQGATYHGRNEQGQPYVLTAAGVVQKTTGLATLTSPQGSMTLKSGAWLMLKSATGAYHQKTNDLDLSGDVTLYRNDGTVMTTSRAQIDLRTSSATGTAPVQVSGPFGVLQAQNGFTLADHGDQIMFHGPATLVLNQAQ